MLFSEVRSRGKFVGAEKRNILIFDYKVSLVRVLRESI
jgi:hypothetical protein